MRKLLAVSIGLIFLVSVASAQVTSGDQKTASGSSGTDTKIDESTAGSTETQADQKQPGAGAAQTMLVSDNFSEGANSAYLNSNWTGCGYRGGAYSKLVYANGTNAGGSGYWSQDCALYTGHGPFPDNQYVTATLVIPKPSSTVQAAVELRGNATPGTDEAYIACGWNAHDFTSDYHYRIWSVSIGKSPVSLYLSTVTPASGDVISCKVVGTAVTMTVNGRVIHTVTDKSGTKSGYPGLYYNDGANAGGPTTTDIIFAAFQAGSAS